MKKLKIWSMMMLMVMAMPLMVACGGDDSSTNTPTQGITQEMIAGDFKWVMSDYKIIQGESPYLNYYWIWFKPDRTCRGAISMEDGYRLVDGRIETYCRKNNEPMFIYTLISYHGDVIKLRMQGTLDDDLLAEITLARTPIEIDKPIDVVIDTREEYFKSKDYVLSFFSSCYGKTIGFIKTQLQLEKQRISGKVIDKSNKYLSDTWKYAYESINEINILHAYKNKSGFGGNMTQEEKAAVAAETRALRAFIYYNIAMLGGDVPLITEPIDDISNLSNIKKTSQSAVFAYAENEISSVLPSLPVYNEKDPGHFTRDAALALQAELALTMGNKSQAKNYLSKIDIEKYKDEIPTPISQYEDLKYTIWYAVVRDYISQKYEYYPVYTYNHIKLFEKEASGNTKGIEEEWKNTPYMEYGYWAALKRLGMAQAVTGCSSDELYMPF